jgi:hypothetical protein
LGPRAGLEAVEKRKLLIPAGLKWRCVIAEIVSVYSCNKPTLFYPSEVVIGTEK